MDLYPGSIEERSRIHQQGWIFVQDITQAKDVKETTQDAMMGSNRSYAVLSDENLKLFRDEQMA